MSADQRTGDVARRLTSTQYNGKGKQRSSESDPHSAISPSRPRAHPLSTQQCGSVGGPEPSSLQQRSADHERGWTRRPQGPLPTQWKHLLRACVCTKEVESDHLEAETDDGALVQEWLWASRPWRTGCGRNDGSLMTTSSGNKVQGRRESGHRKGHREGKGRTKRNTWERESREQIGESEARRAKRRPERDHAALSAEPWTWQPAPGGLGRAGSARLLRQGDKISGRRLPGVGWERAGLAAEGRCCAQSHLGRDTRSARKVTPEHLRVSGTAGCQEALEYEEAILPVNPSGFTMELGRQRVDTQKIGEHAQPITRWDKGGGPSNQISNPDSVLCGLRQVPQPL
ncbi:uncharacterized protein LOC120600081 [Pteropus medius]|uniref:uncharacterized protein LOC120600081 n=1 Tax=Pteropus vampyrus TaxID=132908 RepID=UPI00196A5A36|nr:uncharacterized protein LOC120600081 [Pteropus giganteus]